MGVTISDVQNLNNAISGVGAGFEQRHKDAIEQSIRQRMLDVEMRRMTAEEGRQKTAAAGTVTADLQDEDGNQVGYSGPPEGYQGFVDKLSESGSQWTPVKQPKKMPYSVSLNLPDGTMRMDAADLDELQTQVEHLRAKQKTVAKPIMGKTSKVQENEAAAKEDEIQAQLQAHLKAINDSDASAGGVTGSDRGETIAGINAAIAQSQARKAHVLGQDVPMEVGSEPTPLAPGASPMSKPGTRKVFAPRGQVLNPPTATAATGGDAELQSAQAAIKAGKNPTAVAARYKQRTGKDLPK